MGRILLGRRGGGRQKRRDEWNNGNRGNNGMWKKMNEWAEVSRKRNVSSLEKQHCRKGGREK
jgi:hypothetical protein